MKLMRWFFMLMLWCILLTGCGYGGTVKAVNSNPALSTEDKVKKLVTKMTLEEKVGQMMVVGIPGKVADKDALDLIRKYHVRLDRKLKTSFSDFWEECGGIPCEDKRFYVIPVEESRKEMSELKPSKRANHRRRYELMDGITTTIATSLSPYLKESKDK